VNARNILLVEDDLPFAQFLIGTFRDVDRKLEVFHVNGGYAALSVIGSGFVPEVIVAEDRMPGMSGGELLAHVKANPSLQAIPFYMFISSLNEEGGSTAADVRLPRPTSYREALALVKNIQSSFPLEPSFAMVEQTVTI
jgi:CheY-like chemotaxis protein